jgi:hypothetical protein
MDEIDKQSVDVALMLEREITKRVLMAVAMSLRINNDHAGNISAMERALDRGDETSATYFFCDMLMQTIRGMVDMGTPAYDLFKSPVVDTKIRSIIHQEIRAHEMGYHTPYTTTGTGAGTGIVYTSGTAVGHCNTCGRS